MVENASCSNETCNLIVYVIKRDCTFSRLPKYCIIEKLNAFIVRLPFITALVTRKGKS